MRLFDKGMEAIRQGQKAEGARFIRIALKADELPPSVAAVAYLWLAEATDDIAQKRAYYNDALTLDPANPDARERLVGLLSSNLPSAQAAAPGQTQAITAQPYAQAHVRSAPGEQIVRVIGGPNGPGTAFFVNPEGLLATTRYVTGGLERVTLELRSGRQVLGEVVRAWPDYDLAFLYTDERVSDLLPITPFPRVPDEAPLISVSAAGDQQRGKQRPTKRALASHWVPTDFVKLPDAGGDPIFDERNALIGMMTKNNSRASGYLYGVHISTIHRCVELYFSEMTAGDRRLYCPGCGVVSRATGLGYFYCEVCGSVAPLARNIGRHPQGDPFPEPNRIRCIHCEAQAGFYGGNCLRCGRRQE
jgi:hypothetical protein